MYIYVNVYWRFFGNPPDIGAGFILTGRLDFRSDKGILCYTCDSTLDPKCADPWNYTELYDIGIPIETCMG